MYKIKDTIKKYVMYFQVGKLVCKNADKISNIQTKDNFVFKITDIFKYDSPFCSCVHLGNYYKIEIKDKEYYIKL